MARTIETGWTHPETEDDYRVTLSYEPGSEGGQEEAPSGPEIEVLSVREDKPDGLPRPDLIAAVEAELSGRWGDEVAEEAEDDARDRHAAQLEDRYDAQREERALGGRP